MAYLTFNYKLGHKRRGRGKMYIDRMLPLEDVSPGEWKYTSPTKMELFRTKHWVGDSAESIRLYKGDTVTFENAMV